jgi:predicted RND superfamily exporter protein
MLDKQNITGLVGWIIRNKRIVAIGILIATFLLGFVMIKVVLNADFSTYLRQSDPVVQTFNYIGEKYASKSMGLVLIQADDVFSTETLKLINDLTDAYEELDGVAYATSLTNVLDFKKTEWGLEVGRLIQSENIPRSDEELKSLRDYVLSKELRHQQINRLQDLKSNKTS